MKEQKQVLADFYGIQEADISELEGYDNANFKVELPGGSRYVLKQYHPEPGLSNLFHAESLLLASLTQKFPGQFPEPVFTVDGTLQPETKSGDQFVYRLLKWVDGDFLYQADHTPELFKSIGSFLAKMDKELQKEFSPVVAARKIEWDLQHLLTLHERLKLISEPRIRKNVHYFLLQYNDEVLPHIPTLRHSIIHNDANDWNVLVNTGKVTGIIDFGDMVHAPLIQELAVCLAYALFGKKDPLVWASYVLQGFHDILPLKEQELDVLYYLIAGRLCMSLLNSAYSKSVDPDNEYPGVSETQTANLLKRWFEINPAKAQKEFRIACGFHPNPEEKIEVSLAKRFKYIGAAQSVSYQSPIRMQKAAFQYMYDAYGNTFLDAYNNIPQVGHSHPKVAEAGRRQMARLNTNTRYLYDELAGYAEKLLSKFPKSLNKAFFVNSGSAASDLAIRMAQTYTGFRNMMVLEHGYHGHTQLGIDISHYKFGRRGGKGQADYILKAPIPDTYRGEFSQNDGSAGQFYAKKAKGILEMSGLSIAAFIAEPIVGCAGQVPLANGYLKHLYPFIRKQGGVCISDEVQTGFGRMGSHFWGYELQEVTPDIVVLGKPMGNGHPLAAVVTSDEIAKSFDNGMEFFSSFGGNPVSCAIGMAVLEVIEEEGLQQHALVTGNYFLELMRELKNKYNVIGDVRGHGLFLGLEFVKDKSTKEPDRGMANEIKNKLREQFILVSTDGPMDNIIKMKPPLCFDEGNARTVVEQMDGLLDSFLSHS